MSYIMIVLLQRLEDSFKQLSIYGFADLLFDHKSGRHGRRSRCSPTRKIKIIMWVTFFPHVHGGPFFSLCGPFFLRGRLFTPYGGGGGFSPLLRACCLTCPLLQNILQVSCRWVIFMYLNSLFWIFDKRNGEAVCLKHIFS